MNVERKKLNIGGDEKVDIINVKCNNSISFMLKDGVLPAYHMNKKNWISILLDKSCDLNFIFKLINESYNLTKNKSCID